MSAVVDNWLPRHRITVDEYYRMAEVGLLAPDARVELIEGEIIDMPPIGSPHAEIVNRLAKRLINAVGESAAISIQAPLRLSHYSEPQPDLAVLKLREGGSYAGHPTGQHALLVIEVSETTLRYDRQIKVPLYARRGVPEVWIADVASERMHLFRNPDADGYTDVSSTQDAGSVRLTALPEVAVDLTGLFKH